MILTSLVRNIDIGSVPIIIYYKKIFNGHEHVNVETSTYTLGIMC